MPLSAEAIERAITLNAVAVEFNLDAFRWGRRAALDPALVEARATGDTAVPTSHQLSETLDQVIERRIAFLTDYQDAAYAARYAAWVRRVREAEAACLPGETELTQSVARSLFKLMAYKDEYEVARLYTETDFLKRIAERFEGPYKINFHLAPPLLGEPRPGDRTSAQAQLSARGCCRFSAFCHGCAVSAARLSTFSAAAKSGGSNAG